MAGRVSQGPGRSAQHMEFKPLNMSLLEQQKTELKGTVYLQHGCHASNIHGVVPFGQRECDESISGERDTRVNEGCTERV